MLIRTILGGRQLNTEEFFLAGNPALRHPGWLPPEAPWPELSALHEQHRRLLSTRNEATLAAGRLRKSYEEEDQAAEASLAEALLEGREPSQT